MKIPNTRELQQIALNHSSGIEFKDFMKLYKSCTEAILTIIIFSGGYNFTIR